MWGDGFSALLALLYMKNALVFGTVTCKYNGGRV